VFHTWVTFGEQKWVNSREPRGLEGLFFDLRLALRGLRRDRAFTVAAIAMLALAIGLNATVFTVMDAMLFRGFPLVKQNDRLVYLQERYPSGRCCLSYPDFEDWRVQSQAFEGMAFVASNRPITFRAGEGRPIDLSTFRVSANTFGLLGVLRNAGVAGSSIWPMTAVRSITDPATGERNTNADDVALSPSSAGGSTPNAAVAARDARSAARASPTADSAS
jgi:hypothetical protein